MSKANTSLRNKETNIAIEEQKLRLLNSIAESLFYLSYPTRQHLEAQARAEHEDNSEEE